MEKESSGEKNRSKKKSGRPAPSPGKKKTDEFQEETSGKLSIKNTSQTHRMSRKEVDQQAEEILKKNPARKKREQGKKEMPKEPENPYVKRIRRVLYGAIAVLVLIMISVGAMVFFLFKINTITVEGATRYKEEDIIAQCCINIGDNFLFCGTAEGEENIIRKFAYIEEAKIEKKPFTQINISVKEAKPESVIESNGKYIVLSKSGKVIEINDKNKYTNIPAVLGAELEDVKLCYPIQYKDENLEKYLNKLNEAISDNKLKDIQTIDMSNTTEIKLIRKNGFVIIIGDFEDIEYKLKTAANILSTHVRENAAGRLDVSLASAEGGKSYLKLGEESKEVSETSKKESSTASSKSTESSTSESSAESSEESHEESVEETTEPDSGEEETSEESDEGYYEPDDGDDEPYYEPDDGDDEPYYEPDDSDDEPYYEPDDGDDEPYYEPDDGDDEPYYEPDDGDDEPYYEPDDGDDEPYYEPDDGDYSDE